MDNDEFLKELEQITNSLEKDYKEVIKPTQPKVSEKSNTQSKPILENKPSLPQDENVKNSENNNMNNQNTFGNFPNPFANFGMPFMNPNGNPEECFKELQKLIGNDIDIDENDPENQEMLKMLGMIFSISSINNLLLIKIK